MYIPPFLRPEFASKFPWGFIIVRVVNVKSLLSCFIIVRVVNVKSRLSCFIIVRVVNVKSLLSCSAWMFVNKTLYGF